MVKNVSALDAYREGEIPLPPGYTHRARCRRVASASRGRLGGGRLQRQGRYGQRGQTDRLGRPQAEHQHGLRAHPPSMPA
jgi:hypothetical protein